MPSTNNEIRIKNPPPNIFNVVETLAAEDLRSVPNMGLKLITEALEAKGLIVNNTKDSAVTD